MFFETLIATEDRSYFTDRLSGLTGKPRDAWNEFSLLELMEFLQREIRKRGELRERD